VFFTVIRVIGRYFNAISKYSLLTTSLECKLPPGNYWSVKAKVSKTKLWRFKLIQNSSSNLNLSLWSEKYYWHFAVQITSHAIYAPLLVVTDHRINCEAYNLSLNKMKAMVISKIMQFVPPGSWLLCAAGKVSELLFLSKSTICIVKKLPKVKQKRLLCKRRESKL